MAYTHTFKYRGGFKTQALTGIKAIRYKCLDCCCGSASEVKQCDIKDCPLHPFRMGRYPK